MGCQEQDCASGNQDASADVDIAYLVAVLGESQRELRRATRFPSTLPGNAPAGRLRLEVKLSHDRSDGLLSSSPAILAFETLFVCVSAATISYQAS